jgi:intracellular sulfur oxidation DsrE/DsrF family protein
MTRVRASLALAFATLLILVSGCASVPSAGQSSKSADKVVYHINDSANAAAALRNVSNHLEVNPDAKIVVVNHGLGVDYLMNDAKDKNGNPYNIRVEELSGKGVVFDVCEITLKSRKLEKKQFIPEAKFVPSGVAELGKLQQREGYAYIKP